MRLRCRLLMLVPLVALAAAGTAARVGAQSNQRTLIPIPYQSYIAFNPLGVPADIFTIEGESGVAQGITLGGVASHLDVDDQKYTTFEFKARYYPGEIVLRGFSVGGSLGLLTYTGKPQYRFIGNTEEVSTSRESLTAPTIGFIADYNWLLGGQRRFVIGTGLGAKRVLASSSDRDRVDIDRAYVTARFILGFAF